MPKSKRNRVVPLSKVIKKKPEKKVKLVNKIHALLKKYKYCYVFTYKNMTNLSMNALKDYFKNECVFLIGKNKVMQVALGRNPEEEIKENSHKLCEYLKGNSGLIFTNKKPDDIIDYFNNYTCPYFGKTGTISKQTLILQRGFEPLLADFPSSMETQFRNLGLKLKLTEGKFCLLDNYIVCKEGEALSADQAKMCQHLNIYLDEFKIYVKAYIGENGEYKKCEEDMDLK